MLVLVWSALHFLIVPRIADFRPLLEQQATRALGVNVKVGAVMALSNGLIPSLEFRDVSLSDAHGREALRLPSVLAALSPRSLLGRGFEQLYVAAPTLDVRRSPDGRFWVAGLPLSLADPSDGVGADWLFSQAELVVRQGTVHWTDESRDAPRLTLSGVDLVIRNKHRRHTMRLDVSPPSHWGERIQLMADLKQALFSPRAGQWTEWDGQVFGDFSRVDLSQLRQYVNVGVEGVQGWGALRAWVDVKKGKVTGATVDVALRHAQVKAAPNLEPLTMQWAAGRLGGSFSSDKAEFFTQALEFESPEGLHWPGGNLKVSLAAGKLGVPEHGELNAGKLNIAAMAQIADRLPLPDSVRESLQALRPQGLVPQLQLSWTGPWEKPLQFTARGAIEGLSLSSWSQSQGVTPGITGARADFDFSQSGGKLKLEMRNGGLDLTGFLEHPSVAIDHLTGNLAWKREGKNFQFSTNDVQWVNADGQGDLKLKWHASPEPKLSHGDGKGLGILDLQANFSKVNANQVYKYLPLGIDQPVRTYLKDAIVSGTVHAARLKIKGPLVNFPFADSKQGEFLVRAGLQDVVFAYSPASLMPAGSLPWPALTQLSGELAIDHAVLQVKAARAAVAGLPGLQVTRADAEIRSLYRGATLSVSADARGPLSDILMLVNGSPLNAMTGKALVRATATGPADYRFKLGFPLANIDRVAVQGSIGLAGNAIQ
ncbi:MAG: TIGR02099 family protein, partial [Burkholderiales bacterium PBB4]